MRGFRTASRIGWMGLAAAVYCTAIAWPPVHADVTSRPRAGLIRLDLLEARRSSVVAIALNGGKIADTTIGADGRGSSSIDLSSVGQVQVQTFVRVCKDGRTQVLLLTVSGIPPADKECNDRGAGAFRSTSSSVGINIDRATLVGQQNFFTSPLGFGVIGGAALGGTLLATKGGAEEDDDDGPSGATPDFNLYPTIIGTYGISATIESRTGTCNVVTFTGTIVIGGTEMASTMLLTEALNRNFAGAARFETNKWVLGGFGQGSIPGLGAYSGALELDIIDATMTPRPTSDQPDGSGADTPPVFVPRLNGRETLTFGCGTVVFGLSGNKR